MSKFKIAYPLFIALFFFTIISCDDDDEVSNDCPTAQTASADAQTAYNQDNTNEGLCNALKIALQNEIDACGDASGNLQNQLDALGDCTTGSSSSGTLSVRGGTFTLDFPINSAVLNSGTIVVTGSKQTQGANRFIYFELAENATGIDIMQNFKLTVNGREYFPNTSGFDDFTNEITVNSNGVLQGSFSGIVSSTDGADLSLTQGTLDLTY
ncbi:MAG: hypothetical protein WBG46_05575 [Nonlabens sp.]